MEFVKKKKNHLKFFRKKKNSNQIQVNIDCSNLACNRKINKSSINMKWHEEILVVSMYI